MDSLYSMFDFKQNCSLLVIGSIFLIQKLKGFSGLYFAHTLFLNESNGE